MIIVLELRNYSRNICIETDIIYPKKIIQTKQEFLF